MFTLRGQQYVTYNIFSTMLLLLQALLAKQSEKNMNFGILFPDARQNDHITKQSTPQQDLSYLLDIIDDTSNFIDYQVFLVWFQYFPKIQNNTWKLIVYTPFSANQIASFLPNNTIRVPLLGECNFQNNTIRAS